MSKNTNYVTRSHPFCSAYKQCTRTGLEMEANLKKNTVENFEMCDTPKWILYLLISISSIGLIVLLIYVLKFRNGKKKSRKK